MALVKNVEKRIRDIEHFDVVIRHSDGRDMRSDKKDIPMYDFVLMAGDATTVAHWKRTRFKPAYPGLDVDILDAGRNVVAGNTFLSSVRATYVDERHQVE